MNFHKMDYERFQFEGDSGLFEKAYNSVSRKSIKVGYTHEEWDNQMVAKCLKYVTTPTSQFYNQGFVVRNKEGQVIYELAAKTLDEGKGN